MTIAEWCILGAVAIYLFTIAVAKGIGYGEFDNADPRNPKYYDANPLRARLRGAHVNGMETFPFFAIAILLAEFRHAPQAQIDTYAMLFLAARVIYVAVYAADFAVLRTVVWTVGFLLTLRIFFLPMAGG